MRDFRQRMSRNGTPATLGLILALVSTFLLAWTGVAPGLKDQLAFDASGGLARPWTLLTYPFYSSGDGNGFLFFVILALWLWGIGGDLERRIGAPRYLGIWFGATLIGGLAIGIAAAVMGMGQFVLAGTLIPLGAITVGWGVLNPSATVQLMFVLPITGKWLAWLTYGIVLFGVGTGAPAAGVFACIPLALAHLYVLGRMPGLDFQRARSSGRIRNAPKQSDAYFDDVRKREKERDERERLRKLFESSLKDDEAD